MLPTHVRIDDCLLRTLRCVLPATFFLVLRCWHQLHPVLTFAALWSGVEVHGLTVIDSILK
jgi:hypothetical protein